MSDKPYSQLTSEERQAWTALVKQQALNPSLEPGWLETIYKAHQTDPQVVVSKQGYFPYLSKSTPQIGPLLPLQEIKMAGNLLAYDHQPVFQTTDAALQCIETVLAKADKGHNFVFSANGIAADSEFERGLQSLAQRLQGRLYSTAGECSPIIKIEQSWEDYLAAQGSEFRYSLKRKRKQLGKSGEVSFEWFETQNWQALWQAMQRIEANSWKHQDGSSIVGNPVEMDYYPALLAWLAETNQLLGTVLTIDGAPVAYSLCYRMSEGAKIGQLKTSFDDRFKQYSPGWPLTEVVVRYAFDHGYQMFDFHGPSMPHKLRWTKQRRCFKHYYLYGRGWRARLVGGVKRVMGRLDGE